ncbi:MAG: regulatory protein RecX [Kibdelosporangium sp.]
MAEQGRAARLAERGSQTAEAGDGSDLAARLRPDAGDSAEGPVSGAAARIAELRGLVAKAESQPGSQAGPQVAAKARRRSRPGVAAGPESGLDSESAAGSETRFGARGRRGSAKKQWGDSQRERSGEESDARKTADDGRDPAARAKEICLYLLTSRPRTRSELKQALLRKEISDEVAEQVLGRLDDVGLIDDKAFAEMYVRSRHAYQGIGKRALSMELRRKGVDNDTAAEAVAAVDEEAEEDRARQLVRKKLPSMSAAEPQAKIRRLVGMLARKGYSQGLAYRVVKEELATVGEETALLDHPE